MLFTCPGDVARGGNVTASKGRRRHACIDVHCHVHYPAADDMVKGLFKRENEPASRFSNELTRATNARQMENVRVCLTSVEQRLKDMDKMGVEIQAISVSPFQFMYALDPELGRKTARATNENLADIVQKHPSRFVALANVPLQAPDAAAEELDYCVKSRTCASGKKCSPSTARVPRIFTCRARHWTASVCRWAGAWAGVCAPAVIGR